jgi:putative NADH-flavin reductase
MTVLVLGATGATGKLVVKQLLDRGERVRAIVRFPEKLPEAIRSHGKFSLITAADISRISRSEMAEYLEGCDAVIS